MKIQRQMQTIGASVAEDCRNLDEPNALITFSASLLEMIFLILSDVTQMNVFIYIISA